ncbi:hypothetical protein [Actinokineospora sp. NBRC 105648]|uniref:hypothetical protein n=1 Tax=Actinokineospora sp. NBRC 105648 TaxID=3032206 RepID=UPI0024A5E5A1|nr:hypothetical protein [Actinokineospora sp. NBRC 105648]GLZ38843.1 hypothetical protein Acsp05_24670 [Actinokineospora sp. NBRC 105648]
MSTDGYRADEISRAESLDEDNLKVDPLEEGMDPPERWAGANRFGTTLAEQREGEDLDHRLAAEEPDVDADTPPPGPGARLSELSDRIDEHIDDTNAVGQSEDVPFPEEVDPVLAQAELRGQSADEAGGSVAEALREG